MKTKYIKPFRFYGGKFYLLDDIYNIISLVKNRITCFVDVFGGSGVVAFNLPFKVNNIVYNDINKWLYKTFKVLQDDNLREKLIEKLKMSFRHRDIFNEFKEAYWNDDIEGLSDLEMAFRFLYLTANSFSGDLLNFAILIKEERDTTSPIINSLKLITNEMKNWTIENLDFRELIKKYDSETTFFYLDPPYLRGGKIYKFPFTEQDFYDLKNILDNIKGMWLMNESEVDFDFIKKVFGEPNFVKDYTSHCINARQINGKKPSRLEGFWFDLKSDNYKNLKDFLKVGEK